MRESSDRFDAFISYRREGDDRGWAQWLQAAMETYRPPTSLRRAHPTAARRLRVFRDDTETSASPSLSATIEEALAASRYLIVVASPRSAASEWVDREVRWFLEHGRRDRVLVLLIEGDPTTAFPPSLRGVGEPLAADVRPPTPPSLRARRRAARLRLAAPLLGVDFDALVRRDAARRRRARAVVISATAVLLGGGGALAYGLWSAKEETHATRGVLAGTSKALDETRVAKDAEAAARRSAQAGLAIDRAREFIEGGKPREALRAAWTALQADPSSVGGRILVGRLLRAQAALRSESAIPLANVEEMFRATSSSDSWLVPATGANFQPGVLLVGPDGMAIGPARSGLFARLDAPNVDRSGRTLLAFQPPYAGTAALTLWTRGASAPGWTLGTKAGSLSWSALSPDGRRIAFTSLGESSVHIMDAERGVEIALLPGTASAGAFISPDRIALGRFPAGIEIVDLATKEVVARVATGTDRVGTIVAVHASALVAESFPDGPLLVDLGKGAVVARWKRSTMPCRVAFGDTGAAFVAESSGGDSVRVWDVGSGRLLREIEAGSGLDPIVSFGVRPAHREVVTHHLDSSARIWAIDASSPPVVYGPAVERAFGSTLRGSVPTPFDDRGARMVTLGDRGRVAVWDVGSRALVATIRASPDAVGVGLSRSGDEVSVVTHEGRFQRWSVADAGEPDDWSVELPGSTLVARASPDGALVACGSFEGALTVVRARDGSVACAPTFPDEQLTSIAFSPKADSIVVASRYRSPARVVDVATGQVLRTLDVRRREPPALVDDSAIDFIRVATLVGDEVLSYGSNGVTVWSVTSGRPVATLAPSGAPADALVGDDGTTVLVTTDLETTLWRRVDGAWQSVPAGTNVRPVAGRSTAGHWLGLRSSGTVAHLFVPPARIESFAWQGDAVARSFDLSGAPFVRVELLPTGEIATVGGDGTLRIVDAPDGTERCVVRPSVREREGVPFAGAVPGRDEPTDRHVVLGPAGSWVASIDPKGGVWIADAAHRALVGRWNDADPITTVFAADAGLTLVCVGDRRIAGLRVAPEIRSVEALTPIVERRLR